MISGKISVVTVYLKVRYREYVLRRVVPVCQPKPQASYAMTHRPRYRPYPIEPFVRFSHNSDDSDSNSHRSDLKLKLMSKFEMRGSLQCSAVKG